MIQQIRRGEVDLILGFGQGGPTDLVPSTHTVVPFSNKRPLRPHSRACAHRRGLFFSETTGGGRAGSL